MKNIHKNMCLSAAVVFFVPVMGVGLLCANLAKTIPLPVGYTTLSFPQIDAHSAAIFSATPSAPPALKVVA
jgi:hypothetical protein